MKEIPMTKGYVALIDDDDYGRVAELQWRALVGRARTDGHCDVRAVRWDTRPGEKRMVLYLHRFIVDAPDGMEVDHKNGDTLDNRRCNLRVCTRAENQHNQRAQSGKSSTFKGVVWNKANGKWVAQIRFSGERRYLGSFCSELEAARAYDHAAVTLHGEFAKINLLRGE